MNISYALLFPIGACLLVSTALAQPAFQTPSSIQQRNLEGIKDSERRITTPKPSDSPLEVEGEKDTTESEIKKGPEITLKSIEFFPESDIFTKEELTAWEKSIVDRKIYFSDLEAFLGEINKAYEERGYMIARALLPEQKIKDGHLKIQLIEAKVGFVTVNNNKVVSDDFVKKSLKLNQGDLIRIDAIEESLLRYNYVNGSFITGQLRPGGEVGYTDFDVTVNELPRNTTMVYADNAGRKTVGLYRGTLVHRTVNVLRSEDQVMLAGTGAEGSWTGILSYDIPVGYNGWRIGFNGSYGGNKIIDGVYEPLDIDGESYGAEINTSYPLWIDAKKKLSAYGAINWYESKTKFSGYQTDKEDIYGLTMGLSGELSDSMGHWFSAQEFRVIHGTFELRDDKTFFKYAGRLGRYLEINSSLYASFSAGWQVAIGEHLLPSGEQFQLGGINTIRGFEEGLDMGDHGYNLRAELYCRLPQTSQNVAVDFITKNFTPFVFVDHGGTFPYKGHSYSTNSDDFLTSAGVGLNFNYKDTLDAQIVFAFPLQDAPYDTHARHYLFRVGGVLRW